MTADNTQEKLRLSDRRISIVIVILLLGLTFFIGFLLVNNYRTQAKLRRSTADYLYQKAREESDIVVSFFDRVTESVKQLAEASAIVRFYENKALGMSMEYGLKSSLINISEQFRTVLYDSRQPDLLTFESICFVERPGKCLVHTSAYEQTQPYESLSPEILSELSETRIEYIVDHNDSRVSFFITFPLHFKDEFKGHIIALISSARIKDVLLSAKKGQDDEKIALFYNDTYLPVEQETADGNSRILFINCMEKLRNTNKKYVVCKGTKKRKFEVIVYKFPVADTPFNVMLCKSANLIEQVGIQKHIMHILVMISVLCIIALYSLWRLSLRNVALHAHLVTEAKRADEIEQQVQLRTAELRTTNVQLEKEIEERTKAEGDLRQAQSQLLQSEKMASIGQLAAGVAHEINNPIGYVNSNIFAMQDYTKELTSLLELYGTIEPVSDDFSVEDLNRILARIENLKEEVGFDLIMQDINQSISESLEGIERVKKIVLALKTFSHVDKDDVSETDINEGIESTLNIVWNELKYKAEVIRDLAPDLPHVKCYSQQINQVVMNLLVNAGHAIDERGTITIRSRYDGGEFVSIEVSDTGSGISPEHINKIFDPFFTTKEVGKGTGLGLSVSYNIIKKHGGEITVKSIQGQGTTFLITLPVKGIEDGQA